MGKENESKETEVTQLVAVLCEWMICMHLKTQIANRFVPNEVAWGLFACIVSHTTLSQHYNVRHPCLHRLLGIWACYALTLPFCIKLNPSTHMEWQSKFVFEYRRPAASIDKHGILSVIVELKLKRVMRICCIDERVQSVDIEIVIGAWPAWSHWALDGTWEKLCHAKLTPEQTKSALKISGTHTVERIGNRHWSRIFVETLHVSDTKLIWIMQSGFVISFQPVQSTACHEPCTMCILLFALQTYRSCLFELSSICAFTSAWTCVNQLLAPTAVGV